MTEEFINIDLESIPDDGFPPITESNPGCTITDAVMTKREGGEYPYIKVTMLPASGQVDEKSANTHLFVNLSFSPNALWHTKLFLNTIGISNIKGMRPEELCRQMKGRGIRPTLSIKENNKGKKVNEVNPPYHVFNG